MTLEQLQDHAIKQEELINTQKEELNKNAVTITELNDLNKALQKRNNDLFMKVEQQGVPTPNKQQEDPQDDVTSCEDFARTKLMEEIKK